MKIFEKMHLRRTTLFLAGGIIILSIFLPLIFYKTGNIFFGSIPQLYNVTLAQYLFTYASYPLIGSAEPYAHHQLSRSYFIQGKLDRALREAEKEIEVYPDHWNTYYIIGLTLGYMNREREAIDSFGKFIEHKPESWAARNDRAWLQFRIGDIDGALATIEPVSSFTENPWVQNTYGTLLLNRGKVVEARQALQNAKNIADDMDEASWGKAYPGNDPRIYDTGLDAMRTSIEKNLFIAERLLEVTK